VTTVLEIVDLAIVEEMEVVEDVTNQTTDMEEKIILLAGDLAAHLLPRVVRSPSVGRVVCAPSVSTALVKRESSLDLLGERIRNISGLEES